MEDFLIGSLLVISFILLIVGIISPKGSTRRKVCFIILEIAYFPLTAIIFMMRWNHNRKKAKREQRKNEIYFFWF